MKKVHYEVVASVIIKDDLIFCCKRGNKKECAFKWEFPGGKIENGETREEALKREISEELDAKISVDKYLTTVEYEYTTFLLTMHLFSCHLLSDFSLKEHIESKWLKLEELKNIDFAAADKIAVEKIIDKKLL